MDADSSPLPTVHMRSKGMCVRVRGSSLAHTCTFPNHPVLNSDVQVGCIHVVFFGVVVCDVI